MKISYIYWFAYYNLDSPSVRYRAKYPLDFFRKTQGVESTLIIPGYKPKDILQFLKAYFSALLFRRPDSVIVIQRVQSNFIYANLLKLLVAVRRHRTIYDIDDADYLEVNPATIYYFARRCEIIAAGSKHIEDHLSSFNHAIVHVTSPVIDLGIVKSGKNGVFTIGWIGGFGGDHKESLIGQVFPAVAALDFPLKLVIIGVVKPEDFRFIQTYFADNRNIELDIPVISDWNDETDIQRRISAFDVGIATLRNTQIQLAKSGIKAKQYMNNGVPVLSTDLPENNSVVVDGFNGYLCNNTNDFKERLHQFAAMSEAEYQQFSRNARQSVFGFNHIRYYDDYQLMMNCLQHTKNAVQSSS